MIEWLTSQTATGATFLQVAVVIGAVIAIAPICYIIIRDWALTLQRELFPDKQGQSEDKQGGR